MARYFFGASKLSNVYSSSYHFTELLQSTCVIAASGLIPPRRGCLRSLEKTDLRVRRMRTYFGDRAFSAAGPRCWNSLPPAIRLADSVDSFKVQLKTPLFAKAYPV